MTPTRRASCSVRRSPGAPPPGPGRSCGPWQRHSAVACSDPCSPHDRCLQRPRRGNEPAHQAGQTIRQRLPQRPELQAPDPPHRRQVPPVSDSTGHERSTPPSQIRRVGPLHRPCELGHGQAHRLWHRELFDGRCSGGRGLVIHFHRWWSPSRRVTWRSPDTDQQVSRAGRPPPQLPRSPGQRHRPGSRVDNAAFPAQPADQDIARGAPYAAVHPREHTHTTGT